MSNDLIVDEELTSEIEAQPEPEIETTPEPEAPKSRYDAWDREIAVQNYQELEKHNSRQAQELGELRKLTDQFLKSQQPSPKQDIDLDALLENPTDAINKSLKSNPDIQNLQATLQTIQQKSAVNDLKTKHPDFMEVYENPAFQNWATGHPVRRRILEAANQYDVDAADYIFSEWKSTQSVSKKKAEDTARLEKARSDMGKAASEGAGGSSAQKTFSRLELARLKTTDPDKYEAMWPEIHEAYQNGRVR